MYPLVVLILAATCVAGSESSLPGITTSETFDHSEVLDAQGNYILFWNFNKTHITFEVHVKTKGWVGFGLSDNGNMFPGDVIVGWIGDDGSTHFDDRHTSGHRIPAKDRSQDWHLLYGAETSFGTVLKFVRKINTCDSEDKPIPEDTARLIYAYNDNDPVSDNAITYHGTTRGTKSVSLLSSFTVPDNFPSDVQHYDFLNENYLVPSDSTTYHCRGIQLPNIGKHHMIKYEAVITPGNELMVHHMLLYRCSGIDPTVSDGVQGNCHYNRPKNLPHCATIFLAWAIGGQPFYFPEFLGMSIGGHDDASFYIIETHYDNPTRRSGVIDNSGLRLTLTSNLRPTEAGMLMVGQTISWGQVVPPALDRFVSPGFCDEKCLTEGIRQGGNTSITLFSAMQHAHLLAREIRTRHFRNGAEIDPIMDDRNYDFNFQEMRKLPKEIPVQSGDSILVDCIYDSTGRSSATYGGWSTQEEMCLTFLFYYPKMPLSQCLSQMTFSSLGVHSHSDYDLLLQQLQSVDWTNKTAAAYYTQKFQESYYHLNCVGDDFQEIPANQRNVSSQQTQHPYTYQPQTCA